MLLLTIVGAGLLALGFALFHIEMFEVLMLALLQALVGILTSSVFFIGIVVYCIFYWNK